MRFTLSNLSNHICQSKTGASVYIARDMSKLGIINTFRLENPHGTKATEVRQSIFRTHYNIHIGSQKYRMSQAFWPVIGTKFIIQSDSMSTPIEIYGEAGAWKFSITSHKKVIGLMRKIPTPWPTHSTFAITPEAPSTYEVELDDKANVPLILSASLAVLRSHNWGGLETTPEGRR